MMAAYSKGLLMVSWFYLSEQFTMPFARVLDGLRLTCALQGVEITEISV